MFVEPIRWLLYRKYDDFISDLKLLQVLLNVALFIEISAAHANL